MKKFKILIPVYNDWDSLTKLLEEINIIINNFRDIDFSILIINDASSIKAPKIKVPKNISKIELINIKKNQGHARCNALGIRYLSEKEDFDFLIVMDGDGEDQPQEIRDLVKKILIDEHTSVVAKRVKRSEGIIFQFLYQIHKLITIFFTGKNINFGNYSCLIKKDIKILASKKSLWSSFSGSVKFHILELNSIDSTRGVRYFGPSKMSLNNLILHSFSIIAVFKNIVFLRSAIIIIILAYLNFFLGLISIILQILLVFFNLVIFLVSLRENQKDFEDSANQLKDKEILTH
ncbi:MAG: glycosyltransferase [Pelagibacteraceae bacterium]